MFSWNLVSVVAFISLHLTVAHDVHDAGHVSIIDVLSSSAEFSILIRQLQRTGLVPILNEATNVTFIAPTNAAFMDVDPASLTRDHLLFHLLNKTIVLSELTTDLVVDTFYPSDSTSFDKATVDSYNLPIYLTNHDNTSFSVGDSLIVEQDLKASTGHGVVQVVDKILDIPPSVCQILASNNETSIFSKIFEMEFNCSMSILPSYGTLLIPLDSAFEKQLDDIELRYLYSKWARNDRRTLLSRHVLSSFYASPLINGSVNATALDGSKLLISDSLVVNDQFDPIKSNILAKDGALHFYDSFMAGSGNVHSLLDITPKKYCLALGAHNFVRELKFRGLLDLVNGNTEPQTLFVPRDEQDDSTLHIESTSSMLYHFVHGQHNHLLSNGLPINILLESKSNQKKLGNGNQRIKVVGDHHSSSVYLNGKEKLLGGPYIVGNTTIYDISGSLDFPPSLNLAVGSVYHSSQSANYLNDLDLLDLPSQHGWTVLLPTSVAWQNLGLVKPYLEANETALRGVLESMIFSRPFYTDSAPIDTTLLDGSNVKVKVDVTSDSTYTFHIDDTSFKVETPNVLSSNGVVHSVSTVEFPESISITPSDILHSVDANIFVQLLKARNMSHVLDQDAGYTILAPSDHILNASNITVDTPDIDILLRLHVIPGNPIHEFLDNGRSVESLEQGIHLTAKELKSDLYLVSIVEGDSTREIRVLNRGDTIHNGDSVSTILQVDRFLSPDWIIRITPPFKSPFKLKTPVAILLGVVCGAILIFGVLSCALFMFLGGRKQSPSGSTTSPSGSGSGTVSPVSSERRPLLSNKSSMHSHRNSATVFDEENSIGQVDQSPPEVSASNGYGSTRTRRASSIRSATSEHSISEPIPTLKVQKDREHGRHLGLPRV